MDEKIAKILARQERAASLGRGVYVALALMISIFIVVLDLVVYWLEGRAPSGLKTLIASVILVAILIPFSLWFRTHLQQRVVEIKAGTRIWRPAEMAEADVLTAAGMIVSVIAMLVALARVPNAEALVLMPISAGPVLTAWGTVKRLRIYWKQSPEARRQKYVVTPMAWYFYALSACTQLVMIAMTIMFSTHSLPELAKTLGPYLR